MGRNSSIFWVKPGKIPHFIPAILRFCFNSYSRAIVGVLRKAGLKILVSRFFHTFVEAEYFFVYCVEFDI